MAFLKNYFLLIFLNICLFSVSQNYSVKGNIIDSKTKEPLAFVNIIINDGNYGGTTDIDGKFQLNYPQPIKSLKLSYVGYESKIYFITNDQINNIIELERKDILLPEIVVFPGENPAHRIIKNVIKNRNLNDPEKLHSFSYTSYDKMIFTADIDSILKKDTSLLDTSEIKIKEFFDRQHIFLMETVTERKFLYPDKNHEKVIATRISGLKDPIIVFMISQMQSTSFYNEIIRIFSNNYINPISKGSTNKYLFLLEDTTFTENNDTVFIISYRPGKNTNFDGMKGVLSINSNGWAIQNVIAEPANENIRTKIKIQQMYEMIDGKQWFPVQLNTDIIFGSIGVSDGNKAYKLMGIGKSYLKDIVLNPELVRKEFNNIEVEVEPDAHKKPKKFWNTYRKDSLTDKDIKTYHFIDSIGKAENFDKLAKSFETLMTGRFPWGYFDIDINKFVKYNSYEGFYLGLGLHTNARISKFFKVGGYWGYGFKDKTAKYGGDISFLLHRNSELEVKFDYFNDAVESAGVSFYDDNKELISTDNFRKLLIKRMNNTESYSASLSFGILRYMKLNVSLSRSFKQAYGNYKYGLKENNVTVLVNEFNFTELTVGLRYAYKEKFLKTRRVNISLGTNYPILWFQYTKGFNNLFNGEFAYNRFDLKLEKSFYFKYLGKSSFRVMAGYIDSYLPYCNLYNGNGSYRKFTIFASNSFATMQMNEFLSNKYVAFYFTHNFGKLLVHSKIFHPEIAVATNIGFGSLDNKDMHFNTGIKTMESGYYESGLLLNNLINMKLYSIGAGVFYRYGPYSFDKVSDNFAWKFTITFLSLKR